MGGRVKDESHDVTLPFKVKAKVLASFLGLFFIAFFDLSELPSRTSCQQKSLSPVAT